MIPYFIGISLAFILVILTPRYIGVVSGKKYYHQDGLLEFTQNSKELVRYIYRLSRYFRKIIIQYTFHFLVRMLYYVKTAFDKVYSFARNKFMSETVKDKKAVSRFWETLKEYKQEIDEEKKK